MEKKRQSTSASSAALSSDVQHVEDGSIMEDTHQGLFDDSTIFTILIGNLYLPALRISCVTSQPLLPVALQRLISINKLKQSSQLPCLKELIFYSSFPFSYWSATTKLSQCLPSSLSSESFSDNVLSCFEETLH